MMFIFISISTPTKSTRTVVCMLLSVVASVLGCTAEKDRLDAEAKRLCAIDGGLKVYEVVTIAPEKFNQYGQAQIPQNVDNRGFGYFYKSTQEHLAGQISQQGGDGPGLKKYTIQIIRSQDMKVMGELRYYGRHGGNLLDGYVQGGGFRCPAIEPGELERNVLLKGDKK